ncbi:hypothetical protein [Alkalimarinus alittae]|uniref:Uncharacterized protein n=1 Tax=Alkalimarinus alittae TaxID=2961619 RepID=A0ABY6MX79_9ALTE|nr:hypothetical protein [Alkalimarinus alittae]UZE94399.1 hypothetical protein NKI27_09855 [Alkalimarinus alittae]
MFNKLSFFSTFRKASTALVWFLIFSNSSLAAEFNESEFTELLQKAQEESVVPVMVTLPSALNLTEMREKDSLKKFALVNEAKKLLSELGDSAWKTGVWNNGLGQIGLYATAEGLNMLTNTSLAVKFTSDITRKGRTLAYSFDGSLDKIEEIIKRKGNATVEVFLNLDTIDYELGTSTKTTIYRP